MRQVVDKNIRSANLTPNSPTETLKAPANQSPRNQPSPKKMKNPEDIFKIKGVASKMQIR